MRPNIIPAIAASNKRNKTKKMSSRKLNEHVEEELFNKEKRTVPTPQKPKVMKEGEQPKKPESQIITEGKDPVKKKRPYYRKKYNKPKPVEVIPEPVKTKNYFIHGLVVGVIITSIIARVIWVFN